jgi:hypothetical protein
MKATLRQQRHGRPEEPYYERYHSVSFNAISLFAPLISSKGIQFCDGEETFDNEGD